MVRSRTMAGFASSDSYRRFESAVKCETRYIYDSEVRDFLAAVAETSQKRRDSIERFTLLWRAQRGHTWRTENPGTEEEFEVPDAFDPGRMVPKAQFIGDGRANPRGIPCLYLASTQETAVGEVRPWLGSYISLAQFKVMHDVVIVDCTKDKRQFPNWLPSKARQEIPAEKREEIAWGEIGNAFSRPVAPDEPVTEYVPTQILAEAFRAHGFDGIVYRSLLGGGFNVALFGCAAAELINCGLYEMNAVHYNFDQCSNPYFVSKHHEQLQEKNVPAESRNAVEPTEPNGR